MDEQVISIVRRHWLTTFRHIALETPERQERVLDEVISAARRHDIVFPIVDAHPLYSEICSAFKAANMSGHLAVTPSLMRPMDKPFAYTA